MKCERGNSLLEELAMKSYGSVQSYCSMVVPHHMSRFVGFFCGSTPIAVAMSCFRRSYSSFEQAKRSSLRCSMLRWPATDASLALI